MRRAIELGHAAATVILPLAMQGPFSEGLNAALWRDQRIDCVVTKDSGEAGGFSAKVRAAAAALNIPPVGRCGVPQVTYLSQRRGNTFVAVADFLRSLAPGVNLRSDVRTTMKQPNTVSLWSAAFWGQVRPLCCATCWSIARESRAGGC